VDRVETKFFGELGEVDDLGDLGRLLSPRKDIDTEALKNVGGHGVRSFQPLDQISLVVEVRLQHSCLYT
jgi:hypothetical protein